MTGPKIRIAGIVFCAAFWTLFAIGMAHAEVPVLLPPPQYDHKPLRPVPEILLPWAQVDQYCRDRGTVWDSRETGGRILECAVKANGWWNCIYMAGLDEAYLNQWRRHCIAHVNGWTQDHPDAHYE